MKHVVMLENVLRVNQIQHVDLVAIIFILEQVMIREILHRTDASV